MRVSRVSESGFWRVSEFKESLVEFIGLRGGIREIFEGELK